MSDPWQVLGVSRNATDEEVKTAYRRLAHQYHPDLNPGDENAAKRMQEINAAYDQIKNPEAYRASQTSSGYSGSTGYGSSSQQGPFGGSWDPFGGWGFGGGAWQQRQQTYEQQRSDSGSDSESSYLRAARNLLNARQYEEALHILSQVPAGSRNAEWYFLSAAANFYTGNRILAMQYAQNAVRLDPTNTAYQDLLNRMRSPAGSFRNQAVGTVAPLGKLIAGICAFNLLMRFCLFCRI